MRGVFTLPTSWLLVLALAFGLQVGCFPTRLCGEAREPIRDGQGENQPCVVAETCARPENLGLCLNDSPESPCVACEHLRCVVVSPVLCD